MNQDEEQDRTDRPSPEPVTWLAAISVTAGLVAIAAEGTLAKFLAIPLAVAVAWALVLVSRRQTPARSSRPRPQARRGDRTGAIPQRRRDRLLPQCRSVHDRGGRSGRCALLGRAAKPKTAAKPKSTVKFLGGYSPSNRPTYECVLQSGTCEGGVAHVVFNPYVNAPNYGDERGFVDAKPAGDQSEDGYRDRISVNPGDKITLRIYIDNNADTLTAHDTELTVLLAKNRARRIIAAGSISAANAQPRAVSDTVEFDSAEPIGLRFDRAERPQVTYRASPSQKFKTKDLPSAYFTDESVMSARLGTWPAGFAARALITTTLLVS
ncbi:MAG: hypothetical protein JWQ18_3408 [Conexibacter sp.]|nr:hypothetical protein [Conexibacter sp.]